MLYRFDKVAKSYGPHEVLTNATWQHNPGEHVGLVGRNGAGKTTFFKLLLGLEDTDRGTVIKASGLTIGHLGQHLEAAEDLSLFDYVLSAFEDVLRIESRMRKLEHRLAEPDQSEGEHEKLLEKYSDLQHELEHANGYTLHAEVERVLTGVGFAKEDWIRPVQKLSGGQQNRAMLARVLLSQVDLLLLDEPTNHLDLRGIEFLEEFLHSFAKSYVVISHDRTFLNKTVRKIVELAHGELIEYPGNYDRFIDLRGERHERMQVEYTRQRELVERTEDFIRRNIAGQKTKQAQSRRKMLARLEVVDRPQADETLAKFSLDAGPRSGAVALTAERLKVGYAKNKPIVREFALTVRRGERYAIMGPNGSGKSTVLKTLAGRIFPLGGSLTYGHNVQLGYYDQTLGDLNPSGVLIDEIWNLDHSKSEEEVRNYLARFSFFGEDVFKKVASLSGGEKGRLALAKIMYVGGNLLLLDEPTNHLDVYTREALEEALDAFTGALIVVSHDRYFVDRIAENIMLVEDGELEIHQGNYSELVAKFETESAVVASKRLGPPPGGKKESIRPEKKGQDKRLRKVEQEIASTEKRIAEIERECAQNDELLCSEEVYRDGKRARELQGSNAFLRAELDKLYKSWDQLSGERDALSSKAG